MERLGDYTRTVSSLPKGTAFVRRAKALAQAGKGGTLRAAEIARQWTSTPEVERTLLAGLDGEYLDMILRGAVSAGTTTDATFASALVAYQSMATGYAEFLHPQTIVGKMTGLRAVPFMTRYPAVTGGATVGWVGEGQPAVVSALSLEAATMGIAKASGIIVTTKELADSAKPSADLLLRNELTAAMVQFLDRQFIDPAVLAVVGTSPASITSGVIAVQSTGATATLIAADLATMVGAMADDDVPFAAPYWIMRPADAAKLAAKRDTAGGPAFPDVHVRGGMLLGIPVITSNGVPASVSGGSVIVLVDATLIDYADEGLLALDVATHAALQMNSEPIAGAQPLTSLWQTNSVAWRVTAFRNWQRRRDEAVAVLDNVFW